jgi:hypothetical protein
MNVQNPCASDLDLAAYLEGRLPAAERKMLDRYLVNNRACRHMLENVRAVLASRDDLPPVEEVPERLIRKAAAFYPRNRDLIDLIIALTNDTLTIIRASLDIRIAVPPPVAPLRAGGSSGASIVVMTKSFDGLYAEVRIEKLPGNTCNIAVQITDSLRRTPAENLRIDFVSQGRELDSSSLHNGRVLFEDVSRGSYDVIIQKNGARCGVMWIKIT